MRKFVILILIAVFAITNPCYAIFGKKDYRKNFLEKASNAEKRHDHDSAFFLYEKARFYYKDDKEVLEAYAHFCERGKYYEKAAFLYQKLYELTSDQHYLFQKYSNQIKQDNLPAAELQKVLQDKKLTKKERHQLDKLLIKLFFKKKNWKQTGVYCDKFSKKELGKEEIEACILASEKLSDTKGLYGYYLRYHELYPKKVDVIKKILSIAEKNRDYPSQEKFLRKFADLNPKDKGIKYRLAGFYESQKQWQKAIGVYEELIAQGDKSKHVIQSLAYAKKALIAPSVPPASATAPVLQGKQIPFKKTKEMEMYEAMEAKNYQKAADYLDDLIKKNPSSAKYLRLRVDMALEQKNYSDAVLFFERLKNIKPLSLEDEKLLAFAYSKTENLSKSIDLIEKLLTQYKGNLDLEQLALDYSMAQKDWDRALSHNTTLLMSRSTDEKLLKTEGDLFSMRHDFPQAVSYYEKLTVQYPKIEYKTTLSELYMAEKQYSKAEALIESVYLQNPSDEKIIKAYLNILLAENKTAKAAQLVQKHHLEHTKDGALIMGDMFMIKKDFHSAKSFYQYALGLDEKNNGIKNKLAQSYRFLERFDKAEQMYKHVLYNDPKNLDAMLGLGYLQLDYKEYNKARQIFGDILRKNPEYFPAKIGIANTYVANGDTLHTLGFLRQLPQNPDIRMIKAQTYYDMGMYSDAKATLNGIVSQDADILRHKIFKEETITVIPHYALLLQSLSQEFKLDYNKVGIFASQGIQNNLNIFTEYNLYNYSSGTINGQKYNNYTNEIIGGVKGRPTEKNEFRADIGAKFFEFNEGIMMITDSWVRRYLNDKCNLTLGFKRNNVEQSYLSAVGTYVDNVFTGQTSDNRVYLEYAYKLPKQWYSFGRYGYGIMISKNLPDDPYMEGMLGIGRTLYNNPKHPYINTVNMDLVSYNAGYRYNLLKIYDSTNQLYGGFFSPPYFSANTVNLKLEGNPNGGNFKYGFKSFAGPQFVSSPKSATFVWGAAPYLSYELNDRLSVNLSYNHYNYADVSRNLFIFNFTYKGGKKHAKS
ncbi:MAG: tetratricopeptide repeat protein [Candidatus Gastranaerophilales bacterium]|nr:tetratricopeptide repeat protein [Candidatus Gastranaerophilales bacterium]